MGGVRWKAREDNIVLIAKLLQFEQLVCAKSIIYQESRLRARPSFCKRVENVLNPIKAYRCIGIATIGMAKMPSWGMSCPGAPMSSSRPNNQRVETPTTCRDTLYCSNQRTLYAWPPIKSLAHFYLRGPVTSLEI